MSSCLAVPVSNTPCGAKPLGGFNRFAHSAGPGSMVERRGVAVACCDVLWGRAVATCCGDVLWQRAVATSCGDVVWRRVVVTCCGDVCGDVLWRRVVATCCGDVSWRRVVATCWDQRPSGGEGRDERPGACAWSAAGRSKTDWSICLARSAALAPKRVLQKHCVFTRGAAWMATASRRNARSRDAVSVREKPILFHGL